MIMKKINTRKYKVLALAALVLVAILCLSSCGGSSKAPDASGTITGTEIKWKYTSSDATLEISGKGDIPSFASSNDLPWAESISVAKEIEIEEGITSVGSRAFFGAVLAEKIEIAESVTAIGERAFAQCSSVTEIALPEALTTLGDGAFEGCVKLSSVKIGESLTSLGARAFAFCKSLESVNVLSPVEIKAETFYNCTALKTLIVHTALTEDKVSADAFKGTTFTFAGAQTATDPDKIVTVTIKYVYADGSEASAPVVIQNKIGESFAENSPELEGYTADKLTVGGTVPAENTEIVVTYTEKAVETEAETETAVVETETEEKEPNYIALVIMVVVLAGVGVGAYFLVKSEKKAAEQAKNQNKAKNRKQK